jgi:RNA polymerase sigma-70 factor, ECF subfamily
MFQDNAITFLEYKPLLFVTSYKMTKSYTDSEDILQDVLLDFLDKDLQQITSVKHYLTRSVVNRSLSRIEKRKGEVYPGNDLPEPLPDSRFEQESSYDISFGLLQLLQKLTPTERAVFILKESFDYDYAEIAGILDLTTDYCRQLQHRAREKVGAAKNRYRATAEQNRAFSAAFIRAATSGDLPQFVSYLKQDISIYSDGGGKVMAAINPIYGLENCLKFLAGIHSKRGHEMYAKSASINGQPAIIYYKRADNAIDTVVVIEQGDDGIEVLYIIRNPDKFAALMVE